MNHDWERLEFLTIVLLVFYACVFVSILIDLHFGVKRSKLRGQVSTSYGYRRSISKAGSYFGLMVMMTLIDVIASIVTDLPFFTALVAIAIVLVEVKSVFENIQGVEKEVQKLPDVLTAILKNKGDIQTLITFLNGAAREKEAASNNELNTL